MFCCNVVAANVTTNRRPRSKVNMSCSMKTSTERTLGRMEMDSHANTIVLGGNVIVLQCTKRVCNVAPYADFWNRLRECLLFAVL